ncbi:MAG: hypothetical protein K2M44_05905 [Clostridia bacterium]|nr:hypothetical protein [Clostridia bacterium]
MTLKDILTDVLTLLDIRDVSLSDELIAEDIRIATIVDCVNFALEEIAASCMPLIACDTLEFKDGAASFSSLSEQVYKVIAVEVGGEAIPFTQDVSGIRADTDSAQVRYRYLPRKMSKLADRAHIAVGVPRIAAAYYACAEYALVRGEFDQRVAYEDKFNDIIKDIQRPAKSLHVRQRQWR